MGAKTFVNVTVVVDKASQGDLAKVASALKKKGFVLKDTLSAIGALQGRVEKAALSGLKSVSGVSAVEAERSDYTTQE